MRKRWRRLLCKAFGHRSEFVKALNWNSQPEQLISGSSTSLYRCTRCDIEPWTVWHRVIM